MYSGVRLCIMLGLHAHLVHLIPAPVARSSASAWLYTHPWITCQNITQAHQWPTWLANQNHVQLWGHTGNHAQETGGKQACGPEWSQAFGAGIKSRHCKCQHCVQTWFDNFAHIILVRAVMHGNVIFTEITSCLSIMLINCGLVYVLITRWVALPWQLCGPSSCNWLLSASCLSLMPARIPARASEKVTNDFRLCGGFRWYSGFPHH